MERPFAGIIAREVRWCGCTCTRTHWWTDLRLCERIACSQDIHRDSSQSFRFAGWRVCRSPSRTPCCSSKSLSCSRLQIERPVKSPSGRCWLVPTSGCCWAAGQQSALHYTIVPIEPLFCTDVHKASTVIKITSLLPIPLNLLLLDQTWLHYHSWTSCVSIFSSGLHWISWNLPLFTMDCLR